MAQQGIRPTEEQLKALERKHGDVYLVNIGPHTVALRPWKRAEYEAMKADLLDERRRSSAFELAARDAIVFPGLDAMESIAERYPGVWDRCGKVLNEVADGEQVISAKKYDSSSTPQEQTQASQPGA